MGWREEDVLFTKEESWRAAFTGLQPMVAPAHIDEFLHFEDVAVLGIFEDDKRGNFLKFYLFIIYFVLFFYFYFCFM